MGAQRGQLIAKIPRSLGNDFSSQVASCGGVVHRVACEHEPGTFFLQCLLSS